MPFSLAGLLRLARFCVLHHNSVLIGLPCSVNVQSLSLTRCINLRESVTVLELNYIAFVVISVVSNKPLKLVLIYTLIVTITQLIDECIEA